MGSKTELPHMSIPRKDSMEDLESSFSALGQQMLTSDHLDATNYEGESGNFMSQLSLKLDSLRKDEIFDMAQESPVQALDSLPPPNNKTEHSVPQAPDPLISDDEDAIDGVQLLEDISFGHEMSAFSDMHSLEDSVDIIDEQEVDNKVANELVVQPPAFGALLENTTPMGSLFSNDTSIPPEEHDPKKGMHCIVYVHICVYNFLSMYLIYTYRVTCVFAVCERKRMCVWVDMHAYIRTHTRARHAHSAHVHLTHA